MYFTLFVFKSFVISRNKTIFQWGDRLLKYIPFGGHQTQTMGVQSFIWYVWMYIYNLWGKGACNYPNNISNVCWFLLFIGPLLSTGQPQISGQQNSQDFFNIMLYENSYDYNFWHSVLSLNNFLLKQIKCQSKKWIPKCRQSSILAIIMKIPKMVEIVFRQMPAPRDLPQ